MENKAITICAKHKWNGSYAMYKELHDNGHYEYVAAYLKRKEPGYTTNQLLNTICILGNENSFNDDQGAYAGTHYQIRYMGKLISQETSWSLM